MNHCFADSIITSKNFRQRGGRMCRSDRASMDPIKKNRFRKFFEQHSAIIIVIDAKTGRIVNANSSAVKFYGWPLESLKQMNIEEINTLPPEIIKAKMRKAASSEKNRFEFQHRRADGSIRDVEVFSNSIKIAGKIYLYSIIHDITKRKQAEIQLQLLNEELEQRVQIRTRELEETQRQYLHAEKLSSIGKLSASIAHEFNNPLQGVTNVLKGLRETSTIDEKACELLDLAISESERMKNLIRNLQPFNRPSSGKKELMDVHESINSLLMLSKADFKRKGVSTVLNYSKRLPLIMAIPDQIKQVFLNLLNNAADACLLQSGGVITISIWQEMKGVAVAIKDTGIGMEPEQVDRIFQPFYTTKPEVKGTGLGLSVCHGIVKQHKGAIHVESEPGKGSTFTLLLPINAESSEELFSECR